LKPVQQRQHHVGLLHIAMPSGSARSRRSPGRTSCPALRQIRSGCSSAGWGGPLMARGPPPAWSMARPSFADLPWDRPHTFGARTESHQRCFLVGVCQLIEPFCVTSGSLVRDPGIPRPSAGRHRDYSASSSRLMRPGPSAVVTRSRARLSPICRPARRDR